MRIVSVSTFRKNVSAFLKEAAKQPIMISRCKNQEPIVVISMSEYERLLSAVSITRINSNGETEVKPQVTFNINIS